MARQAGVVDAFDQGLLLQEGEDAVRVLLVGAQARSQGAQAAQGEVGIERPWGETQTVGPPHQRLGNGLLLGNRHAAHHVRVAVDVFGGGVDHQIRPERQRLLQQGGEEGVVHHYLGARFVGSPGDGGDVHYPQQRVGGGLYPYQRRFLRKRLGQRRLVPLVDEQHLVVALGRQVLEQAPGTAVTVVGGDQQISCLEQGRGDQVDGTHAGAGDHGAGPPSSAASASARLVRVGLPERA